MKKIYRNLNIVSSDIDECKFKPCSDYCHNTIGSYYCSCQEGYKLDKIKQRKCYRTSCNKDHGCQHFCETDKYGNFQCNCYNGFQLLSDGKKCQGYFLMNLNLIEC